MVKTRNYAGGHLTTHASILLANRQSKPQALVPYYLSHNPCSSTFTSREGEIAQKCPYLHAIERHPSMIPSFPIEKGHEILQCWQMKAKTDCIKHEQDGIPARRRPERRVQRLRSVTGTSCMTSMFQRRGYQWCHTNEGLCSLHEEPEMRSSKKREKKRRNGTRSLSQRKGIHELQERTTLPVEKQTGSTLKFCPWRS